MKSGFLCSSALRRLALACAAFSVWLAGMNPFDPAEGTAEAEVYVAVIGVAEYEDNRLDLKEVKNDVAVIRDAFCNSGAIVRDKWNPKLGAKRLLDDIADFFNNNKTADTVVIYWSGHGMLGGAEGAKSDDAATFLTLPGCKYSGQKSYSDIEAVSATELRECLQKCCARNKILILDACHSGGGGTARGGADPDDETAKRILNNAVSTTGTKDVVTIASCSSNEQSYFFDACLGMDRVKKEQRVSFFTHWLELGIRGLADSDGNGVVSVQELFSYIEQNAERCRQNAIGNNWVRIPTLVVSDKKNQDLLRSTVAECRLSDEPCAIKNLADGIASYCAIYGNSYKNKSVPFWIETEIDEGSSGGLDYYRENAARSDSHMTEASVDAHAQSVVSRMRENLEARLISGLNFELADKKEDADVLIKVQARAEQEGRTPMLKIAAIPQLKGIKDNPGKIGQVVVASEGGQSAVVPEPVVQAALKISSDRFTPENAKPSGFNINCISIVPSIDDVEEPARRIETIDDAYWVELNPGETFRIETKFNLNELKVEPSKERPGCGLKVLVDGRSTLPPLKGKRAKYAMGGMSRMAHVGEQDSQKGDCAPSSKDADYWVIEKNGSYMFRGFYDPNNKIVAEFSVRAIADADEDEQRQLLANKNTGVIELQLVKLGGSRRDANDQTDVHVEPGDEKTAVLHHAQFNSQLTGSDPPIFIRYASGDFIRRLKNGGASGSKTRPQTTSGAGVSSRTQSRPAAGNTRL